MEEPEIAAAWRALSDPTRRRILDMLSAQPMTTGQIAEEFAVSRIAVMKHLAALSGSGLVVDRKRGRQRWHYLNFLPLQQIYDRWIDPTGGRWATTLLNLKHHVEGNGATMADTIEGRWPLAVDIAQDVLLGATREQVFEALTNDIAAWWGPPYVNAPSTNLILEPVLGGRFYEVWGEGAGALLANVSAIAPGERLELSGRFHMGVVLGVANFEIEHEQEVTLLRFTYQAVGETSRAAEMFEGGFSDLLGVRLKAFVESGERLGINHKK